MIVAESSFVAIGDPVNVRVISFSGKSTDAWPIETWEGMTIQSGSHLFLTDILDVKFYDADTQKWLPEEPDEGV